MKVQVIKKEIPEGFSELGGCSLQIVNKETVDLETTIDEAKDQLCVVGDKLLVKGEFIGLFKSMVAGIQRDGNARTIGDFLTLYPVPTGEFDLDRGWNPAVNGVRIRARLMNEMEIDISKWEFEDVTPGRQPFTIESIQAGAVTGVVECDKSVAVNGRNLPATADARVEYAVPETGGAGVVPSAKVTSSATRLDIAADALAALNVPANDGKRLELTVRGNFANAKIAAVLKYVKPTVQRTMTVANEGGLVPRRADTFLSGSGVTDSGQVTGEMFKVTAYDQVTGQPKTVALAETAFEYAGLDGSNIRLAVPGSYEGEHPWGDWVDYTKTVKIGLDYETGAAYNKCAVTASFAEA